MAYLSLPLLIWLLGWLEVWAAVPLVLCVVYALKPLVAPLPADASPITRMQLLVAVLVGCGWTVFGGTGHFFFANHDWYIRDAVLHDLVASPWPVGYGLLDGKESLLRAPIGFYMPAALVGKVMGLYTAHLAMSAWTAAGATIFLLQVLSLLPSRPQVVAAAAALVVLFSGLDIVGNLVSVPRFIESWNSARHLEWWAGTYQYSSMTTQMFWVPNHALGGWLLIGLLYRDQRGTPLDSMLPIIVVAITLWSPLAAIGVIPFVLWKVFVSVVRERCWRLLDPRVWAPALLVGIVVGAYLTLDSARIHHGWEIGGSGSGLTDIAMDLLRLAQFWLLEAGLIGFAILALGRSKTVLIALAVLAVLPLVNFGPGNDLVMRSSIPSLTVLAIAACLALLKDPPSEGSTPKRVLLCSLLALGAVTPFTEFTRSVKLPAWPINLQATLIGAACGQYPEHYVAHLGDALIGRVLRQPHRLPLGPQGRQACDNPGRLLYYKNIGL